MQHSMVSVNVWQGCAHTALRPQSVAVSRSPGDLEAGHRQPTPAAEPAIALCLRHEGTAEALVEVSPAFAEEEFRLLGVWPECSQLAEGVISLLQESRNTHRRDWINTPEHTVGSTRPEL